MEVSNSPEILLLQVLTVYYNFPYYSRPSLLPKSFPRKLEIMPLLTATIRVLTCHDITSSRPSSSSSSSSSSLLGYPLTVNHSVSVNRFCTKLPRNGRICAQVSKTESLEEKEVTSTRLPDDDGSSDYIARQSRRSADWKAARAYRDSGFLYKGRIEGFNGGGLLVRFYSLVGFLPFPQLSPSHSCKEPDRTIHDVAKGLNGQLVTVKVIVADEENKKLIFSEREAVWTKYSERVNVGDIFSGRVGSVEDFGAFIHLKFPDGLYYLTGLVHVSEISWDLVHDIRDILSEGDEVRVKVTKIDREKSRITLSIKQLEEDPLLETLDKVIPQDSAVGPDSLSTRNDSIIEPLPGLEAISAELLQEDGIDDVRITRQGFEKRVVSQDLQLWLSNAPPVDRKFTLLARAGRQVQEIQLTTSLDQDGIKAALQRVLERIP